MQPRPRDERIVVDPRPGKNGGGFVKPQPIKSKKPGAGRVVPNPGLGVDDRIYRTMPITEKQLGTIKKMYGIK